jgi:hypothetical protein
MHDHQSTGFGQPFQTPASPGQPQAAPAQPPANPELRRELKEAFDMLDSDRKGYLNGKEMKVGRPY